MVGKIAVRSRGLWLIILVGLSMLLFVGGTPGKDVPELKRHIGDNLPIVSEALSSGFSVAAVKISQAQQTTAIKIALKRWGKTKCDGPITYRAEVLKPLNLMGRVIAQSEWFTGQSPNLYLKCSITINKSRPTLSFPYFCAMVMHEYGHLSGFFEKGGPDGGTHSANRRNIMYPVLNGQNVPRDCLLVIAHRPVKSFVKSQVPLTAAVKGKPKPPLRIGSQGKRVKSLQWLLSGHRPSVYRHIKTYHRFPTGVYGKPTADAVRRMKYRLGWPATKLNNVASQDLIDILLGHKKRPYRWIGRAGHRAKLLPIIAETTCAQNIVKIARKEIGIHEIPDGSNNGPRIHDYQKTTGAYGVAWCASFDQWVFATGGYGSFAGASAYVPYIRQWAYSNALLKATPKIGALAIFYSDSHHIGIVSRVVSGGVYTVEGNSSNRVVERFRSQASTVMAFVWLPGCHYPLRAHVVLPPGIDLQQPFTYHVLPLKGKKNVKGVK